MPNDFVALKHCFILVDAIFSSDELLPGQKDIARDIILQPGWTKPAHLKERLEEVLGGNDEVLKGRWAPVARMLSRLGSSSFQPVSEHDPVLSQIFQNADAEHKRLSSTEFFSRLRDYVARMPFLDAAIQVASQASQTYLRGFIGTQASALKDRIISIREREREEQLEAEVRNEEEAELAVLRNEVVEQIKKDSEAARSKCVSITASSCLVD